ncbi:MAG: MMPL family transporter [Planctomycetes bacterium]|nr:MMPL family transporter [Planctomycetota bacterium]
MRVGISERLLRHPRAALACLLVLSLAIGSQAIRTEFDASIRSFILDNDPDYAHYQEYKRVFGQDAILVAAFESEDVFSSECLHLIQQLTERFEGVEKVYDVQSLSNAEYIRSTEDSFEAAPLVESIGPPGDSALPKSKAIAMQQRIYLGDMVSKDSKKTSIIVTFATQKDADYDFHPEMAQIEAIVREESARSGVAIHLMGEKYLDWRFLQYIHKDLTVFVPLTFLVLAVFLFLVFRTVRETLIALTAVGLCMTVVAGMVPFMGFKMDAIMAGVQPMVLCIGVTDVIHLLHRYRYYRGTRARKETAVQETLREAAWPCFVNSVTSSIGFGSLILNDLRPISSFGWVAALGILACYPICVVTVFSLVQLWDRKPALAEEESGAPNKGMVRFSNFIIKWRWSVASACLLVMVLCAVGISKVNVQVDRVKYLKDSSDLSKSIAFLDAKLSGTMQLDVWVDGKTQGSLKEPDNLRKIEDLAAFLRGQEGVDKVICINDFVKEMNKAFFNGDDREYRLPETRNAIAQYLLIYSMSGRRNQLDRYVDYPYSRTRVSVRSSVHNSQYQDDLIAKVGAYLAKNFDGPLQASVASSAVASNNVFHYLIKGLIIDLSTAGLLVGIIMCLMFRSVYAGIVSMIPNVLPLVACMGLMGWADVWLEIATAMTFSIAMGIAVDDTIHLMSFFKHEIRKSGSAEKALRSTFSGIGTAMLHTSFATCSGFLILLFASLKMNVTFGLLACFVILIALLCEAFVMPVSLLIFKPFAKKAV